MNEDKYYLVDSEQLANLCRLSGELHGGTDRERDYGHRLWLLLNYIKEQEAPL